MDARTEAVQYVPPSFPIKCDLCDGLPFMGCVHNCPTGAAMRIDAGELFESVGAMRTEARIRKTTGTND
jgi:ferredoxin